LAATDFLTEARIRNAKPKGQPYKLRDGGGLYLLITPANARLWRLRYKVSGRESMLGLGTTAAAQHIAQICEIWHNEAQQASRLAR
jgi:Arm DNA-binding domain